ncbi:hypothetical protein ACJVC5_13555 [Peredibacter sp. HCB2-198]|uniref:hypothetical protein n=1 Tax=Peredibacter sp. HCB2-198 TaxID=3383025 RepID=UPI0038B4A978
MIFYTLQGPSHELEIHDDKLSLIKKGWRTVFSKENPVISWELQALSRFEITAPKFLFWGKIEWQTYDGHRGSFRFSTNPVMVKKIESYMQKRILKDFQNKKNVNGPKKAA